MTKQLVNDELWQIIKPLLPEEPPKKPEGGRPRIDNRAALTGIVFVLKSGIPWEMLPQEMGCGSGITCCFVRFCVVLIDGTREACLEWMARAKLPVRPRLLYCKASSQSYLQSTKLPELIFRALVRKSLPR